MTARAVRLATKAVASAADRLRHPARGTVILIFHRVGGRTRSEVDLPLELFRRQISWLSEHLEVETLDEAVDALGTLPPSPASAASSVVVTFDDGTADFVEHALPVLVDHAVPATLFVATDFVERNLSFPGPARAASWSGLRDALSTGLVTLGSHTHTHALLDRLEPAAAQEELDRSVALLEDRLGVDVRHFAYPKAVPGSADADALVRSRFRSAALGGNRPNLPGRTDLHRLARSAIQTADGMRWFVRKVEGGMALEDDVRRRLNRRRYAAATS